MLKLTLRLTLTIACLSLAGLTSSGQTKPAPATTNVAATNAPATNAPTATPPVQPIALADVVTQAQSVIAKLQDERTDLVPDQIIHLIGESLPPLAHQIDEHTAEDEKLLAANPSLSSLQNSQALWQSLAERLAASEKDLSDRATKVNEQSTQLDQLTKTWQATFDAAKKASTPQEAMQSIQGVIAVIADTTKAAQADQAQLFAVQTQVAEQKNKIKSGLDKISKAMETARARLFEQDHPALWNLEALLPAGEGIVSQEKVSLHTQLVSLQAYIKDKLPAVFLHLLLLALLIIGFYWIRSAIRTQAKEEAALHHAALVFDVPLATALLLALLASGFLYPLAPRLLWAIVGAVALVPAVIVIRRLIEPELYPLLYATVIAYLFDQLRYVAMPAGVLSRFLFIFELLAASIFLLTVLRSKHFSDSQSTDRAKLITRIYLHVAFLVFVFAGFANAFGYVQLSALVGNGMLVSSYLAVVFYAAVRIIDALAISALSIRPFTRLGMVRKHRELLYANLSTCIRWLAFASWAVVVLQIFTLRDPLWHETNKILATHVKWFSLKLEVGAILAFPITVWASFLLSRLIRFALEEEVYPHLQLGRGIPYASSTMVHYLVLVLGFFAALAAAKVDLSRFTILAGAFGVGLGFGLQNIMNNFVSGVILLFERPIKVGDVVQIDTNMGKVERIGIRASVILLANGAELIVPNGNLISNPVTNWTLSNCERLIEIPISVASKVDPQHVVKLLIDVAKAHPDVIKNPPPQAFLVTFGGTALTFRLRAWVDSEEEWMKITSDLSLAINAVMAKENITLS